MFRECLLSEHTATSLTCRHRWNMVKKRAFTRQRVKRHDVKKRILSTSLCKITFVMGNNFPAVSCFRFLMPNKAWVTKWLYVWSGRLQSLWNLEMVERYALIVVYSRPLPCKCARSWLAGRVGPWLSWRTKSQNMDEWWLYCLCMAGCMEECTRLFTVNQSWQESRRRGLVWGCAWILAGPFTVEGQAYVITHHKLCCPSLVCEWPGNWCC